MSEKNSGIAQVVQVDEGKRKHDYVQLTNGSVSALNLTLCLPPRF